MLSRRDFGKLAITSFPVVQIGRAGQAADAQRPVNSTIRGVRMGLQSACFTFSGLGLDDIVKTMVDVGLAEIDVMSAHVEHFLGAPGVTLPGAGRQGPWARGARGNAEVARGRQSGPPSGASAPAPGGAAARGGGARGGNDPAVREALRAWRLGVDLERFAAVGRKFSDAGLSFFAYNLSFNDSFTDAEIERGMLMAKSLGTRILTVSSPLTVLPRVAPLAEKHDVIVALHNHTTGPGEFAQAMALSRNIGVNLDVGHFFASGHDPIAYIRAHHQRITNLHVKDRMSNNGAEMPFGQGETPLRETLLLVREERYSFPVCIEYVGPDGPAVEIRRCFDYCRSALMA